MANKNDAQEDVIKMRKIVAGLFMSLDGVVDSPERWGFPYTNEELTERIAAGMAQADAVLLGPRTYRLFAQLWQHRSNDVPMANFLNNSPKYVVTDIMEGGFFLVQHSDQRLGVAWRRIWVHRDQSQIGDSINKVKIVLVKIIKSFSMVLTITS